MPTLLKKFSLEDAPAEVPQKLKPDVLQGKYISAPAVELTVPKKVKEKPKSTRKPKENTDIQNGVISPKKYLYQLPTLIIGIICYLVGYTIFQKIQPEAIKNLLIPHSFIVLILILGVGHLFISWYLTQQIRRSFFLAIFLSGLLFLRLQQLWNPVWLLLFSSPIIGLELLLTYKAFRR